MSPAFREYLYRPRELRKQALDAAIQKLQLWGLCTRTSAPSGENGGRGGGDDGAKDGKLALLIDANDLCRRLDKELEVTIKEMLAFSKIVETADTKYAKRDAAILKLRYVRCRHWDSVFRDLNDRGFKCDTLRTVFKWNRDALKRIEKIWEETNEHTYRE